MSNRRCLYCRRGGDLRPYGPGGEFVCFKCAMTSPEREAEAKAQFTAKLAAIDGEAIILGHEEGPIPAPQGEA